MNHKPGSVTKSLRLFVLEFYKVKLQDRLPKEPFPTAIYLGQTLQSASVQSTRGIGRAALPLLDFAPNEAYRIFFSKAEKYHSRYCRQYRGGLLPRHFTLAAQERRYTFCCAVCRKAIFGLSPGCYPASCPAEPGLSSRLSSRGGKSDGSLVHRYNLLFFVNNYLIVFFLFFFIVFFFHVIQIRKTAGIFVIEEILFFLLRFLIEKDP